MTIRSFDPADQAVIVRPSDIPAYRKSRGLPGSASASRTPIESTP